MPNESVLSRMEWFRRGTSRRRRLSNCVPALILVCGLTSLSGCRGDQASRSGFAWFRPPSWFQKQDEPLPADEFPLKPIPRTGDTSAPPAPPRFDLPPPAPVPDAASDGDDFYGVRRTAADDAAAATPSWSDRFRNLFGDGSQANASPVTALRDDASEELPLLQPVPPHAEHRLTERR